MIKWFSILLPLTALALAGANSNADKDVLAAMDAWKQATMKKDRGALQKLLHDDLTYTHSSGMNQTKAEVLESVVNGKSTVEAIEFTANTVRVYGNTALVKGKVDITNVTDGKSTPAHLDILHVWLKNSHGWQMVARQAVRVTP